MAPICVYILLKQGTTVAFSLDKKNPSDGRLRVFFSTEIYKKMLNKTLIL